jgi:hypothetical protein
MRREGFGEEVATSDYVFRFADGSERAVKFRVGQPYQDGADGWACPVELAGFERRYADIRGADSMQALNLAIAFALLRVEDFIEKGGKVLDGDGQLYSVADLRKILGR